HEVEGVRRQRGVRDVSTDEVGAGSVAAGVLQLRTAQVEADLKRAVREAAKVPGRTAGEVEPGDWLRRQAMENALEVGGIDLVLPLPGRYIETPVLRRVRLVVKGGDDLFVTPLDLLLRIEIVARTGSVRVRTAILNTAPVEADEVRRKGPRLGIGLLPAAEDLFGFGGRNAMGGVVPVEVNEEIAVAIEARMRLQAVDILDATPVRRVFAE